MAVGDIDEFRVENYKSIDDSGKIEIDDLNILIGKNDAGKSAFLEALRKFLSEDKPDSDHFHQCNGEEAEQIIFTAEVKNMPNELVESISDRHISESSELTIERIFKNKGDQRPSDNTFVNGEKVRKGSIIESGEKLTMAQSRSYIFNYLPEPLWIPAERDVTEETKLKGGTIMNDLLAPILRKGEYRDSATLQEKIDDLEDSLTGTAEKVSRDLTDKMKTHMSSITGININTGSVNLSKAVKPKVTIEDQYLDREVNVRDRGSGVGSLLILSLMETYVEMEVGEGYCLLFEEPGNFLHPAAERRMLSALQEIAQEGQACISTHSQTMIDQSDSASLYVVRRNDGKTGFEPVKEDAFTAIDEIGARNSDLLQSDFVIYVEGPSDVKILEEIAQHAIEDWNSYNIVIQHLGGTGSLDHCTPEKLEKINRNFAVLLDSDQKSESGSPKDVVQNIKEKFEYCDKTCKVLNRREIENYYHHDSISAICHIDVDESFVGKYNDMEEDITEEMDDGYGFNKIEDGKDIVNHMYSNGKRIEEVEKFLDSCIREVENLN